MNRQTIQLTYRGDPQSQQRPRFFKRGNRWGTYDAQALYKKNLKNRTKDYIEDWEFDNGVWEKPTHPRVSFFFYMPIPKSMDRRTREKADTGKLIHVKKPDIDNLVKLYLDVISGIVIHDDNCVTIDQAVKIYSKNPKTVLVVTQGQEFYERDDGDDI